jgi:uncharacterized protein (TIGR01777 family)
MRFLITGATGFIGKRLVAQIAKRGHESHILARQPALAGRIAGVTRAFAWPSHLAKPPREAFEGVDTVINLAGEPVVKRFTPAHLQAVRDSRIGGTTRLLEEWRGLPSPPQRLVSASAIGYYGDRGSEVLDEASSPGTGFLADLCREWESTALSVEAIGVSVCRVRIGIVLGPGGGALEPMLTPFKMGLGGPLAGGRGWMSWIHLDDLVALLLFAGEKAHGPVYNGTAPNPVTNAGFTRELGRALHRPAVLPVPALALKLALGEGASVVLQSARVLPHAAERDGFRFQFPELPGALAEILNG